MANNSDFERAQPVVARMRQIGEAHGGKTPSQVALNWVICKGALPIPGASKVQNLQQNAGALGWRLGADEVAALDQAGSVK
jgi:aryl-alcohol dehydrogenase-like predicted oxidoreductase